MERLLATTKNSDSEALTYLQATTQGALLTAPANITTKFREAFEAYIPGSKWVESKASGDIVMVDGNAVAASYLVVSKDPLAANTVTEIETVARFAMPIEMAVGLSMSQRTLGQEFAVEVVSDEEVSPVADIAIASISQSNTTLTVNTTMPHGLVPGKRIGIKGVTDSRMNYLALVVATIPSPTQITCTAGPNGSIPTLTVGPFTSGFIYFRSALGFSENGTSLVFENTSATNGSVYVRSESGDALPSGTAAGNHSLGIGSTSSVQAINAPYTYAFQPTTEYKLAMMADRLQWSDAPVDTSAAANNRSTRSQVVPDSSAVYKFRIRATNNDSLTRPVARIVSAVKSGTSTVTVTTAEPHGLTSADWVQVYGVRDQSAVFGNLSAATSIAVTGANTFTVAWGTAATASTQGGCVVQVNGGTSMQGLVSNGNVQSINRVNGILFVTTNVVIASSIGDYINLYACRRATDGGDIGIDGAYRLRNIVGLVAEFEPIGNVPAGIDIAATNCGGVLIRRTDLRISFVRVFDFERERVEIMARPSGDIASALPVAIQNTPSVVVSGNPILGAGGNNIGFVNNIPQSSITFDETNTNLAANATFTGASRDVGSASGANSRYSAFNVVSIADQVGVLRVEMSRDGTTWKRASADIATAINVPMTLSVPIVSRFYRCVYVNGATAQAGTAFMINSSFTGA
jgi:hypothetical protein